jgi:hypothetical protein
MVTPQRLLRLIIEIIFVLLGGLVVWLGVTEQIFFDRRKTNWVVVSIMLILWGLWAIYKPNKWWAQWESWTRGLSLTFLGVVMLAISRVPFAWVSRLLAAGGVLLMLRGIIGAALVFRPRPAVPR